MQDHRTTLALRQTRRIEIGQRTQDRTGNAFGRMLCGLADIHQDTAARFQLGLQLVWFKIPQLCHIHLHSCLWPDRPCFEPDICVVA